MSPRRPDGNGSSGPTSPGKWRLRPGRVRADTHTVDTAAPKRRLGDIFVERGLVTQEQLDEALAEQREKGGKLGEVLVELGFITRVGARQVSTGSPLFP